MFTYCGNNPVNRMDPSGQSWKSIKNFIKKAWNSVKDWASNTFGGETSIVYQTENEYEYSPAILNMFITVKEGARQTVTMVTTGDSSKPISVYAEGRSDNFLLSSAGVRINVLNFTLEGSLGLDDIGIRGSIRRGDSATSIGIKADISQLKIGFEGATTVRWDSRTDVTNYTNVSVSIWGIIAVYMLATTGQTDMLRAPSGA